MTTGERVQSVGPSGISRFLAEHRACDAGLEVFRDEGAPLGRLLLGCKGCGASVSYGAPEVGEKAVVLPGLAPNGVAAPVSSPSVASAPKVPRPLHNGVARSPNGAAGNGFVAPKRRFARPPIASFKLKLARQSIKRAGEPTERPTPSALPWSGRPAVRLLAEHGRLSAGVAVLAGVVLLSAVVLRSGDGTFESLSPSAIPGSETVGQIDSRYAVNVPEGWVRTQVAGLPGFSSPDGSSTLRVYVASGTQSSVQDLLGVASSFLTSRNPEGDLSTPQQVSQNGYDALRVASTHSQGQDVALAVQAGDVSYVVWLKVEEATPAKEVNEAKELLASFTPTPVESTPEPPPASDQPSDPAPSPDPAPSDPPPPSAEAGAESPTASPG